MKVTWKEVVYVPITAKLYFGPLEANNVLVVDPLTNISDTTAIADLGNGGDKWMGAAFVPTIFKLYFCPWQATSVLIVDPLTNGNF